jgi:hypothetical protein
VFVVSPRALARHVSLRSNASTGRSSTSESK